MSTIRMQSQVSPLPEDRAGSKLAKRLFDVPVAAILLFVCLPVIAVTALAVYLSVGRPLMFRQERAGKEMRPFHISKFRTMSDARNAEGQLLSDELRTTPMTSFLRRIRVDELPQVFTILSGEMSFIGPRPLPIATLRSFGEVGRIRCAVPPGMTGWAQVNGNTRLSNDEKIALDIWYVDKHHLLMDVRIVLMTIRTIILGEKRNDANIERALAHLRQRAGFRQPPVTDG